MTATGLRAQTAAEEAQLRRRIDNYLVRRRRPQTLPMLSFIFGDRVKVLRAIVQLERAGKVRFTELGGWEATQVPE